ncbi:MAG: thioredoxin domain-containing protein [Deltaproteobacteria bacterium]|nr:thioredoxin domain-containing protein [Deltaproteobacteria bacterium]
MKKLEEMKKIRGAAYKPRTKHLRPDGWAKYTNRLFLESSPYLLQHAHNPVNWYPWGDEAFETAIKLNCPVLLSIGYSTCHWCHVMEEESFEDEEIARYLNENYIAVKVDREERPDVDAIYMSAVQALTGSGGWPMTVWLTPDRKPFYGGTYFPARDGDRGAGAGFLTLLKRAKESYDRQPDIVAKLSQQLTEAIRQIMSSETGKGLPTADVLHRAMIHYRGRFDWTSGGMAGAPKFPSSLPVRLLFRYYRRTGEEEVLKMAQQTLKSMAGGGIYDHVGGGFHRYSTDQHWLIPHFEKMLYDNALLIITYLEGFQVTGDEDFKRVITEILRYVKQDMTSPEGAFYSATDADSLTPEGHLEEGCFFTWTSEELEELLGKYRARIVRKYYSVGSTPDFEGRHILNAPKPMAEIADSLNITEKELTGILEECKEILYKARNLRSPPIRDEKILTAWNGLMISAHALAGLILDDSEYIERAVNAAQFVLERLYIKNRLYRSYKDNKVRHNAYLDDYAFFIAALLDLYESNHNLMWLEKAIELDKVLENYYEDKGNGGFFMTSNDHEDLIAREKPYNDGAIPSGNSVAVLNLLRLGEFTTKESYRQRAERALISFSGTLTSNPAALSEMLHAVDFFLDTPKEIIIVTPKGKKGEEDQFLNVFREQFLPNRILTVVAEGEDLESHAEVIPLVQRKSAMGGKATAYICEKGVCELPTSDPKVFSQQIKKVSWPKRSPCYVPQGQTLTQW